MVGRKLKHKNLKKPLIETLWRAENLRNCATFMQEMIYARQ